MLALLGWIIVMLTMAVLLVVVFALAVWAGAAAGIGLIVGLLALVLGAAPEVAIVLGLGSGAIAFPLIAHAALKRPPKNKKSPIFGSKVNHPIPSSAPIIRSTPKPSPVVSPEPAGDESIGAAWILAEKIIPDGARRLPPMRAACAQLLHAANADGFDQALREGAILVRKHVPDLVKDTEALLRTADPDERDQLATDLSTSLEICNDGRD
jgi:hypothetical protein